MNDYEIVSYDSIKGKFDLYCNNYFDLRRLHFYYETRLYKKYNFNSNSNSFTLLRYYSIHFVNQISLLKIPFIYTCFYKEKIDNYSANQVFTQYKEYSTDNILYWYFFNQFVYQLFKIIDNTYVCLNDGLSLGVNQAYSINEAKVSDKLIHGPLSYSKSIIKFYNYVNAYSGSVLEKYKNKYRNNYTHDFELSFPKLDYDMNNTYYYTNPDFEKGFKDMIGMLKKLEKHIKMVDLVLIRYINNKLLQ